MNTHSLLTNRSIEDGGQLKDTPANRALFPPVVDQTIFDEVKKLPSCYYADENTILLNGEAFETLNQLRSLGFFVNSIVTSPPYYGQRDYGVEGSLGLESHPSFFIENLTQVFCAAKDVLTETGSLWLNIGDTYWSGKGASKGVDAKQSARRFGKRPQDFPGDGLWARPKQLLLIPHRLAIALQEDGWLVRNDNIWIKPNPLPDFVRDRSSVSHEHVFHFAKSRWYYYNSSAVAVTSGTGKFVPPKDTWTVDTSSGQKTHKASYPAKLLEIPVRATTPRNGVVLDPFVGSGTTLLYAKSQGFRSIGIELNAEYCEIAKAALIKAGE